MLVRRFGFETIVAQDFRDLRMWGVRDASQQPRSPFGWVAVNEISFKSDMDKKETAWFLNHGTLV